MAITIIPAVRQPALCIHDLGPRKRDSALQLMLAHARDAGALRELDSVYDALLLRERAGGTGVGKGVAVPNARALAVLESRWVLARSERGIEWDSPDGQRVHLVLLVLSPPATSAGAHLDAVARAMSLTRFARSRAKLLEAPGAEAMAALIRDAAP